MKMKIQNATVLPKVYYGLHFSEGCAEYRDGGDPFRIFIGEQAMKNMDPTFAGIPVYVRHVDEVNLESLQNEADGYVVESFFNKADGKHWAKFIVVSDRGHEAIAKGWKLSNAYRIKRTGGGGRWHGMDYDKEVLEGEYEHLAIVPDPRYDESIILTPEQFKTYNDNKEAELLKLANSKSKEQKGEKGMLKFFKREKVENSADLEKMDVTLPKSGKEVSLMTLINQADEAALNEDKPKYAVEHELVKTNEGDLKVSELVNKYNEMCEAKKNAEAEELAKKNAEEEALKKQNEEEEAKKKAALENEEEEELENEEEVVDEKKQNSEDNFKKLQNAHKVAKNSVEAVIETSEDQVARGKSRYGSK